MRIKGLLQGARHKLDAFYDGVCSVSHYEVLPGVVDQVKEVAGGSEIPCHLDYGDVGPVEALEPGQRVVLGATLFLAPEVEIAPGSRVSVKQNGVQLVFEASGEAAVYQTHQEVPLRMAGKWA